MGNLQCQTRLAHTAGAGDGDETDIGSMQELAKRLYLLFSPNE
jgi:hypothetical protein